MQENAMHVKEQIAVDLRPWSDADLPLLERLLGDPAMTMYLGGPETPEQIRRRHERYLREPEPMMVILAGPERTPAGMIGYWEHTSPDGTLLWETGWSVLSEFQGQGVATQAALLLMERARAAGKFRYIHAFSAIGNRASNGVCRNVGFVLQGEVDLASTTSPSMRCYDWRLDLEWR
jgi:RimJ/RimL family protein N-acetyltransferase